MHRITVAFLLAFAGCSVIGSSDREPAEPAAGPSVIVPNDRESAAGPPLGSEYRIRPGDSLYIEFPTPAALPSYHSDIGDVFYLEVKNCPGEYTCSGYFGIESDGTICAPPRFENARVLDMTVEEIKTCLERTVRTVCPNAVVGVRSVEGFDCQVKTKYTVDARGAINLGKLGTVRLAEQTVSEARANIEKAFATCFQSPEVIVEIGGHTPQTYFLITCGGPLGRKVTELPLKPTDTIADAVKRVADLQWTPDTGVWVQRSDEHGRPIIISVEHATVNDGRAAEYDLMPGDRLFIEQGRDLLYHYWASKGTRFISVEDFGKKALRRSYNMMRSN